MVPLLFLSWRYLVFQSVLINVVRALMPQRPEALTSYFGYRRGEYTPVGHFRAFVWIGRDILVWMQMGVVLLSIVIRWFASRTAFVSNRTKVIASGGADTLASFLFSMAASSLFFAGAGLAGLAVFEPIMVWPDYQHHSRLFLSFFQCASSRLDIFLFSAFFFLALGSSAEHLSRREIIAEAILYRTDIGKHITLLFRIKRQVSVVATFVWVAFFFVRKDPGTPVLFAIRIISIAFATVLISLHAGASYYGLMHLFRSIKSLKSDLGLTFKRNGVVPSFLLQWSPRREGPEPRSWVQDWLRVAKNFYPIMLWHVSGRTIAAQIAMFISLCNWLPLLPGVQVALFACVATFTAAALLLFRLSSLMNPTCTNTSGDDIPTEHVGFGMLTVKCQLLHADTNPDLVIKMVPASIERLFEAVTISYRWDPVVTFPVRVWHRTTPMTVQFQIQLLRRAFQLLEQQQGVRFDDHTLVWFDQAAIDQESERFKMLLVPRMTACYALSVLTLVLDNTDTYEFGSPDNYYSRIWTFQEYCIPPCIAVFTGSPLKTPEAVVANRRSIQDRYWSSSSSSSSSPTRGPSNVRNAVHADNSNSRGSGLLEEPEEGKVQQGTPGTGAGSPGRQQQQQQQQQLFLVVGLDTAEDIQQWLQEHPELIREYMSTIGSRIGYKSSDRFAAIMQVIAGVICFTPAAVLDLKRAVLAAMAHWQEQLRGFPLIDNTEVGSAAGRGLLLPGSADAERLLAGRPCPGDSGHRTSLTLSDIELVESGSDSTDGSSSSNGGGATSDGGVGGDGGQGRCWEASGGDQGQCIDILGSYVAFEDHTLPPIGVKASVDPVSRRLKQLVVWPHHSHVQQQYQQQQQQPWSGSTPRALQQLQGTRQPVRAEAQLQQQLSSLLNLQLVPVDANEWEIVLE